MASRMYRPHVPAVYCVGTPTVHPGCSVPQTGQVFRIGKFSVHLGCPGLVHLGYTGRFHLGCSDGVPAQYTAGTTQPEANAGFRLRVGVGPFVTS